MDFDIFSSILNRFNTSKNIVRHTKSYLNIENTCFRYILDICCILFSVLNNITITVNNTVNKPYTVGWGIRLLFP